MNLFPHQTAFIQAALGYNGPGPVFLEAEVGMGKSWVMPSLVKQYLQEQPKARCLFLVPGGMLLDQFSYVLRDKQVPFQLIDRYRYRELLEAGQGEVPWPAGAVMLMSMHFAAQEDVCRSLSAITWDLVMVDEGHQLRGKRGSVLNPIIAGSSKAVIAQAYGSTEHFGSPAPAGLLIQWSREKLIDAQGAPLARAPRPLLHEHAYDLSADEEVFFLRLKDLRDRLLHTAGIPPLYAALLDQGQRSSTAQLERSLMRILKGVARPVSGEVLDEPEGDDEPGTVPAVTLEPAILDSVRTCTEQLLRIEVDSKALRLVDILGSLQKRSDAKICLLTSFQSTYYYLATVLESAGCSATYMNSRMLLEERHNILRQHREHGGLLIATRSLATEVAALQNWTDLILYELPMTAHGAESTIGVFDRIGRSDQLQVHVLLPTNDIEDVHKQGLESIKTYFNRP